MYEVRMYTELCIRMCAFKFFCLIILWAMNQQKVENWTSDESSDTDIDRDNDNKADQQEYTPTLLPTTIHYLLLFSYTFLASSIQGIKSSNQVVIEVCEVRSTTDWQGIPVRFPSACCSKFSCFVAVHALINRINQEVLHRVCSVPKV